MDDAARGNAAGSKATRSYVKYMLYFKMFSMERRKMAKQTQSAQLRICILLGAALLASCTAPVPQAVQTQQSASENAAQLDVGRVISIRPVTFTANQSAEISGVNAVLTALGQGAVVPPVTGEEIVIQKDDGNPAALSQQSQPTSLAIGQRVVVVQGAPVAIIGRN